MVQDIIAGMFLLEAGEQDANTEDRTPAVESHAVSGELEKCHPGIRPQGQQGRRNPYRLRPTVHVPLRRGQGHSLRRRGQADDRGGETDAPGRGRESAPGGRVTGENGIARPGIAGSRHSSTRMLENRSISASQDCNIAKLQHCKIATCRFWKTAAYEPCNAGSPNNCNAPHQQHPRGRQSRLRAASTPGLRAIQAYRISNTQTPACPTVQKSRLSTAKAHGIIKTRMLQHFRPSAYEHTATTPGTGRAAAPSPGEQPQTSPENGKAGKTPRGRA